MRYKSFLILIFIIGYAACYKPKERDVSLPEKVFEKLQFARERLYTKYGIEDNDNVQFSSSSIAERGLIRNLFNRIASRTYVKKIGSFFEKIVSIYEAEKFELDKRGDDIDNVVGSWYSTLVAAYKTTKWTIAWALDIPIVSDIVDETIKEVIGDLPIETINELIYLVPWESLDSALKNIESIDVDTLVTLYGEFHPLAIKVQELYYGNQISLYRLLRNVVMKQSISTSNPESIECKTKRVVCYYPNWAYYRKGTN